MSNPKQEVTYDTKRLYRCIMHDFHDGVDRQDMWEKELQLVINSEVTAVLDRIESKKARYVTQLSWMKSASVEAVPLSAIQAERERYMIQFNKKEGKNGEGN